MSDRDEWVMSCGAKDHEGWQRHHGALINWRRRLRGFRKVHPLKVRPSDTRPWLLRRYLGISELNRRIIPADWRYPYSDGHWLWKHRGKPMVLGRGDGSFDGGPVGKEYRR